MIPILDLSHFHTEKKNNFVKELGKAYEEIGFVAITGHGFPTELSQKLYEQVQSFFRLDESTKLKYRIEGLAGQRGYTPFGMEHAKDKKEGDLKEFWQFGIELTEKELSALGYPSNPEVTELPHFKELGFQTYNQLLSIGMDVLRAIALHLQLDEFYFDDFVLKGNSILRPIHYPPIKGEIGEAIRSAEHEDINLITLLMGASAAGLQVKDKKGNWVDVSTPENALVVNVGDMLQRLTNKVLVSTTHRVINTPEARDGKSRYSIPFFLHPKSDMPLNCLKECTTSQPPQYENITAGEYLDERLREIGLK
jgi:isopenicillin N synthase-like dioxygenase